MTSRFDAIWACSIALCLGRHLSAKKVTASNGKVIDWRYVPSGHEVLVDADTIDVASMFVELVGYTAAIEAATSAEAA